MKIKRRYPNFFTGFEETEHEVSTKEELMNIDWIKNYNKIPNHMGVFYSPKSFDDSPDMLMSLAKDNNGKVIYFVVGYIYGDAKELGLEDYKNYV